MTVRYCYKSRDRDNGSALTRFGALELSPHFEWLENLPTFFLASAGRSRGAVFFLFHPGASSPTRASTLPRPVKLCLFFAKMAVTGAKEEIDYTIKPEAGANNISTAEWPLLLKNYDKRM